MSELEHGSMVDLEAARGRNAPSVRRKRRVAVGRSGGILWGGKIDFKLGRGQCRTEKNVSPELGFAKRVGCSRR